MTNHHSFTYEKTDLDYAMPVDVVDAGKPEPQSVTSYGEQPRVDTVANSKREEEREQNRKKMLFAMLEKTLSTPPRVRRMPYWSNTMRYSAWLRVREEKLTGQKCTQTPEKQSRRNSR